MTTTNTFPAPTGTSRTNHYTIGTAVKIVHPVAGTLMTGTLVTYRGRTNIRVIQLPKGQLTEDRHNHWVAA